MCGENPHVTHNTKHYIFFSCLLPNFFFLSFTPYSNFSTCFPFLFSFLSFFGCVAFSSFSCQKSNKINYRSCTFWLDDIYIYVLYIYEKYANKKKEIFFRFSHCHYIRFINIIKNRSTSCKLKVVYFSLVSLLFHTKSITS